MTMSDEKITIGSKWPRRGGIRLTLPGIRTDGPRATEVKTLAHFVRSVLSAKNKVTRLEILSWPGEDQQEWVIFPDSTTSTVAVDDDNKGEVTEQATLADYEPAVSADRDERSPLTGALESKAEDNPLFDTLGYDICDVDFAPIERAIRPTCRLVVGSTPDLHPLKRKKPHPIADLITDLNQQAIPYLLQTIITIGHNADYDVSQRLAVYPPEYGIGVEGDFAQFLTEGPITDLNDYYDPANGKIRTNFDLDGHKFFRVEGTGPEATVQPRQHGDEVVAERARRILQGKYECHKLYAGYHDTDKMLETLYQHRNFYSKIPVDSSALGAFLAVVPDYFDNSLWGKIGYAGEPSLIVRPKELPATAATADETHSDGTPRQPQTSEPESESAFVTQGSEAHQFDESAVAEYYDSRGFDVARPDTESADSVPDLVLQKDGQTYFGEVERSGTSQPANILTNAARAAYCDVPVYFFVKDKSAARTVAKVLRDPVKAHTETGAQLYTQSKALTLSDGGKPVLPQRAASESQWYLINDDPATGATARLELRVDDGRTLASGPVDESVATWEYDTDIIPADRSVPDNRTRTHPPFVPTRLAYLNQSKIRYQRDINEFSLFERGDYQPGWDYTDQEGKRKRYTAAFGQFVETKLITVEGADLQRDVVIPTFLDELYNPQTTRKAPGQGEAGEAGRALWKHVEKKEITPDDDSGRIKKLKNRTWRWPLGIESPDLPFVGNEAVLEQWL
jgi:hypothetical protein